MELERESLKWISVERAVSVRCLPFPSKKWDQKTCFSPPKVLEVVGLNPTTWRQIRGLEDLCPPNSCLGNADDEIWTG